MVSAVDQAKRALISLINLLSQIYKFRVTVTRDSGDTDVSKAYRALSKKVHPDKGGKTEDQKKLNNAYGAWEDARKHAGRRGRPSKEDVRANSSAQPVGPTLPEAAAEKAYQIHSAAVLLTYHGFVDLAQWFRFLAFVRDGLSKWRVRYWTGTLETNENGNFHVHLMLQFTTKVNRSTQGFFFEGLKPNAQPNDLLGEMFATKKWQASVDRGHFYAWADKKGTVRDSSGEPCRAGNYTPAWTSPAAKGCGKYRVAGKWPQSLWEAYKLDDATYEEYMYLCKDGLPARQRNLETFTQWREKRELQEKLDQRAKRLRSNPQLFQPFKEVPQATAWLKRFEQDAFRYPVLVVHGPSRSGKTEWACSLFNKPLKVEIADLLFFPEGLRELDRKRHDGLVLDDVRDLEFLNTHQDKLQGHYARLVEFASTPGGTCSYHKDLWRLPTVLTVNNDTRNLQYLQTRDFCSNRENVVVLSFRGRPGEVPPAEEVSP